MGIIALALMGACSDGPTAPRADEFEDEPAPDPHPEVVAFVDVHVVPMDRHRLLEDFTVVVRGDRIEAMGPSGEVDIPDGAFVIEGRGRYLLPGLADMHVHLTADTFQGLRNDFVLFLANGVTTIRVMWGGGGIVAERDRIAAGEVLGPTMLVASPGLDGPGGTWTGSTPPVATAEEGRQRVADHDATGYDYIKVYNDLDRPTYDAIVDEASARDMPVVGHVPRRVGIRRVQDAGQLTLEHFIGVKLEVASPFTGGVIDIARARDLIVRSRDRGVWHTPTITVDALSTSRVAEIRSSDEIRLVSPGMRDFFETGFHNGLPPDVAAREDANHRALIAAVADAGGGLLIGTDAGFGWIVPGYSIHDELAGFVRAGLSPYAALSAATASAAHGSSRPGEFGTITPGVRADLMLLAGNPLAELSALREVSGVMVRGRWLSRGTLAAMLDDVRAASPRD